MIAKTLALLRKITFCFQFRRIWQIFMNVKAQKNHVKKFLKWLSSSQSRLNESHFVIVSVALFHSLIRTEVKDRRRRKKKNLFSKHSVSLTMSIGFRQIITPRGQNRGRQLFAEDSTNSPFCSTAIVQWRRPFGLQSISCNNSSLTSLRFC